MNTIAVVPVDYIHQAWAKCGHMIEAAMEHAKGECTAEQLKVFLVQGQHSLMLFLEDNEVVGAVEFMIDMQPNDRVFYINAIGGKTTKEHTEQMFNWAKSAGATTVRGCARESVARLWRMKYNFESIYIMVEKRL
jgi:hypothetical protein